MEHIIHNLKPIYNEKSKILILGSMPSTISRIDNFYYANKKNCFWPIMQTLLNISLGIHYCYSPFIVLFYLMGVIFHQITVANKADKNSQVHRIYS